MKFLDLKPTHKAITTYYAELQQLAQVAVYKEGAVSPAFANLLRHCAAQFERTLIEQDTFTKGAKHLFFDGAIKDKFNLTYGVWEAKGDADEPEYIVNLIQRVVTVSVETIKIVKAFTGVGGKNHIAFT